MWCPATNWCGMAPSSAERRQRLFALWGLVLLPTVSSASSWPDLKLPDGTRAAEVSSHMIYNGTDMRGQVFTSVQPAADIIKFYRGLWGKQSVLNQMSGWQVIGHRDGNFYITVQVRPE